ncbi:jupiter microtubule associated homolog 1 isoform X1 [Myotis myotis]|uniref:jupiter microtubule associated homolog 1 isoform X1 n=1 Tax=Myotis myotis TaxID=51298 RepID=UPI0017497EDD|nr:jupiter microtubule associated homolog 1 isoform X1 [Myotis myotis]
MTTTTTFKGVDPNSRNSSRVLRPPGGGSNFSLGFDEPTEQPVRKNKMASSIFGTPEENPPSWAKSAGAKSSGGREDPESSAPQRRNSSEASSGDFLDLKGEGDIHVKKTYPQVKIGKLFSKFMEAFLPCLLLKVSLCVIILRQVLEYSTECGLTLNEIRPGFSLKIKNRTCLKTMKLFLEVSFRRKF